MVLYIIYIRWMQKRTVVGPQLVYKLMRINVKIKKPRFVRNVALVSTTCSFALDIVGIYGMLVWWVACWVYYLMIVGLNLQNMLSNLILIRLFPHLSCALEVSLLTWAHNKYGNWEKYINFTYAV